MRRKNMAIADRARIVRASCADRARIVRGSCASRVVENLALSGHKNELGPNCGGMSRGYGKPTLLPQHTCTYRVVEGVG